jgi:hypothetical protein
MATKGASLEWLRVADATVLTAGVIVSLVIRVRSGESVAWRLTALGLFGFISFTAAGMWLTWISPTSSQTSSSSASRVDPIFISLNYYYNSPVSLFIGILVGAGARLLRSATAKCTAAVGIILATFSSITTFQSFNDVVRFLHLGPIDTSAIFEALNAPPSVPMIIVTGDKVRFEKEYRRYDDRGRRLFGSMWWENRDYEMRWQGTSYGNRFGNLQSYGEGLCTAFKRSKCPITFLENGRF